MSSFPKSDAERRRDRERTLYQGEVGEPYELPEEHPDRWQWDYTGSKAEREVLLERLELADDEALVIDGQRDIFGGEA